MITQVDAHDFREAFKAYGRMDNFSYKGLDALFEYLEALEEDTGTPYELDVIALCCEFYEYDLETFLNEYTVPGIDDCEDEEEKLEAVREYLDDNTMIVVCEADCILFQAF